MTEEQVAVEDKPVPFRLVGDAGGLACAGDVCELPAPAPTSLDVEQLNP